MSTPTVSASRPSVRWLRLGLLCVVAGLAGSCRTTPLDNIWPGCCPPAATPVVQPAPCPPTPTVAVPWSVVIDERVSPIVDCNPIQTQHTLVCTVLDQNGNPLPGQRVEWILGRFPEAVGDIVASDDQYGVGAIAPIGSASVGNNGNKIDNHYALSVTNYGPEMIDAGNNHPYVGSNGARLPDITVGTGQSWVTITSGREGVTDIICYVPAIQDGTKHKIWARKIWADFQVGFPENAVNTLPEDTHDFPVTISRSDGSGIPGQTVDAEILDGPGAVFASSGERVATLTTDANGDASFRLRNATGETGVNRIRFTANGSFYGEVCPRSAIVTKRWQKVALDVSCAYPGGGVAVVDRPFDKTVTITNTGDASTDNVVLDDQPDSGLSFADGASFPMDLGPLAPGQSITRTFQMVASAPGTYTNTVMVRAGDATARNTCPIEVVQGVLEITKVCEPSRANAGQEITFVVTVENTGRGPLENVQVMDDYPEGIEPTSQDRITIGTLLPGDSRQVIFTGIADVPGTYTNVARATADGSAEKRATCELTVVQCRLEMELVGPETIYYGDSANFSVVVRNVGDGEAEACVVRVSTGQCLGGRVQDFNVGPLGPGDTWTQDFAAIATNVGSCSVEADSSCGASCAIRRDIGLRVTGLPALQVEMIDRALDGSEQGIFSVGETFIYRLTVENDLGTEPTPSMVVRWQLPPELEFVSGRSDMGTAVTGSGRTVSTETFALDTDGDITFEITVRALSAPGNGLVKTPASIELASDGTVLASEEESTTLRP